MISRPEWPDAPIADGGDPPSGDPLTTLWNEVGQPLLHQQCWCWGWDIRRADGNLLLERGFRKLRPPHPDAGTSTYRLRGHGYALGLWGFGTFYGRPGMGGVFIGRYAEGPLFAESSRPPEDVWLPLSMPAMTELQHVAMPGTSLDLFAQLLDWVARYERWVQRVAGPEHRAAAIDAWGDKTVVSAHEMAASWHQLSAVIRLLTPSSQPETGIT